MANVFVVYEYSNMNGDTLRTILGVYSKLELAEKRYQQAIAQIKKDWKDNITDEWIEEEDGPADDKTYVLADDDFAAEYEYELNLVTFELDKDLNL